jgi:hypothetical protein
VRPQVEFVIFDEKEKKKGARAESGAQLLPGILP